MDTLKIFKNDFYNRLGGLQIFSGQKVLDYGCGDGTDSVAIAAWAKSVVGVDLQEDPNWKKIKTKNLKFLVTVSEKTPFKNGEFTGLFVKDVIHHVSDRELALKEIKRVSAKNASIVLIEANRYNPLFFLHMTLLRGHDHLTQSEFKALVKKHFPQAKFIFFESHYIPCVGKGVFGIIIKIEKFVGNFSFFRVCLSFNVALINCPFVKL